MKKTLASTIIGIGNFTMYYPSLARKFRSIPAALLLSQLLYWTPFSKRDGWVFKKQEELEEELGLSRSQQETARRKMRNIGIVEERQIVYGIIDFKVNLAMLPSLLSSPTMPKTSKVTLQKTRKVVCRKSANQNAENQHANTENTPETTVHPEREEKRNEDGNQSPSSDSQKSRQESSSSQSEINQSESVRDSSDKDTQRDSEDLSPVEIEEFYKQTFRDDWQAAIACDRDFLAKRHGKDILSIHVRFLQGQPPNKFTAYRFLIAYSLEYRKKTQIFPTREKDFWNAQFDESLLQFAREISADFLDDPDTKPVFKWLPSYCDRWTLENQDRLKEAQEKERRRKLSLELMHRARAVIRDSQNPALVEQVKNAVKEFVEGRTDLNGAKLSTVF